MENCSEISLQPYARVKMIQKGSRDGPISSAKPAKILFQAFALWYKNHENRYLYSRCPRPMAAPTSPWSRGLEVAHSCSISSVNYALYVFKFVKNI